MSRLAINHYKDIRRFVFEWDFSKMIDRDDLELKDVAREIGVHYGTVRKWYFGESFPHRETAILIERCTGLNMSKYFDVDFLEACVDQYNRGVDWRDMV